MTGLGLPSPAEAVAFLDPQMKYTSGLYLTGAETLHEAQTNKLRFIADLLGIQPGAHVLDVGCGWGALTLYLAQQHQCHVCAVTPTPSQARFVRQAASDRGLTQLVRVEETTIERFAGEPEFDAIAMVGVIEHLPSIDQPVRTIAGLLRPAGRIYVSASCYRKAEMLSHYAERPGSMHVTDSVFGFGVLRPVSALIAAVEDAGMSIASLTDLTGDYRRTIAQWAANVEANRDRIEAAAPGQAAELLRYFATANAAWGYTSKHYAFTASRLRMGLTGVFNDNVPG